MRVIKSSPVNQTLNLYVLKPELKQNILQVQILSLENNKFKHIFLLTELLGNARLRRYNEVEKTVFDKLWLKIFY